MRARPLISLAVVAAGVVATTATSSVDEPVGFELRSTPKTLTLTLTEAAPEVRFAVTATSTLDAPVDLRAETNIDDDNADVDANDGLPVVDVGVVAPGAPLADPVDDAAGAAAVREGAFAVQSTMQDGAAAVVLRLRPGETRAVLRLILTGSSFVATSIDGERIELEVEPEAPLR